MNIGPILEKLHRVRRYVKPAVFVAVFFALTFPAGKLTARQVDAVLLTTDADLAPTSVQRVEPFRACSVP